MWECTARGANRPGQGHGSSIFTVRKRRASARPGARTDSGRCTAARFLRCGSDVRVLGQGPEQTRAGARQLDFCGTEATCECTLDFFSECTLNAKRECTLDSAPHRCWCACKHACAPTSTGTHLPTTLSIPPTSCVTAIAQTCGKVISCVFTCTYQCTQMCV